MARVARAPDGSWYAVWREDDGWSVGNARESFDFSSPPRSRKEGFELASDAQLVAELWAAGRGRVLREHDYVNVQHQEDKDRGWVADSWGCRCGASELDFDNVGEAAAAARSHWREALRAALARA